MGDTNLHAILEALSAPMPSPAAAGAAAASAAMGAALLVMAAQTTARRLPDGPERSAAVAVGEKAGRMRNMLEDIYEQDPVAYARVMGLRKQRASPERDELLCRAWKTATIIPGAMGRAAMICLRLAAELIRIAPPAVGSDIAIAAWHCHATVLASLTIVRRNLAYIQDTAFHEKILRNLSFLDDRDAFLKTVVDVSEGEM